MKIEAEKNIKAAKDNKTNAALMSLSLLTAFRDELDPFRDQSKIELSEEKIKILQECLGISREELAYMEENGGRDKEGMTLDEKIITKLREKAEQAGKI